MSIRRGSMSDKAGFTGSSQSKSASNTSRASSTGSANRETLSIPASGSDIPMTRGRRSRSPFCASLSSLSASSRSTSTSTRRRRRRLCRSQSNSGGPPIRLRSSRYWAIMDRELLKSGYRLQTSAPSSSSSSSSSYILHGTETEEYDEEVFPDRAWDLVRKANRVQDGKLVIIRSILERSNEKSQEMEIIQFLNSEEARREKGNRTVRLLDVLNTKHESWSCKFIVMEPSGIMAALFASQNFWKTPDSWLDFIVAVFEVYAFLHSNEIAHVDIAARNILIHPQTLKITLIDFEASKRGQAIYVRDFSKERAGRTLLEDDMRKIGEMFLEGFQSTLKRYPLPPLARLLRTMHDIRWTGEVDRQRHKLQMTNAHLELLKLLRRS